MNGHCATSHLKEPGGLRILNNIVDPGMPKRDVILQRESFEVVYQHFCHVQKRFLVLYERCQCVCDLAELIAAGKTLPPLRHTIRFTWRWISGQGWTLSSCNIRMALNPCQPSSKTSTDLDYIPLGPSESSNRLETDDVSLLSSALNSTVNRPSTSGIPAHASARPGFSNASCVIHTEGTLDQLSATASSRSPHYSTRKDIQKLDCNLATTILRQRKILRHFQLIFREYQDVVVRHSGTLVAHGLKRGKHCR